MAVPNIQRIINKNNPLQVVVQKKTIHATHVRGGENTALKEVLNKITAKPAEPVQVVAPMPEPAPKPVVESLSLDALKQKIQTPNNKPVHTSTDRAATAEDMNKLKELIIERTEKVPEKKPEVVQPAPAPTSIPIPVPQKKVAEPPLTTGNVKEVPEDVLKKLLE